MKFEKMLEDEVKRAKKNLKAYRKQASAAAKAKKADKKKSKKKGKGKKK